MKRGLSGGSCRDQTEYELDFINCTKCGRLYPVLTDDDGKGFICPECQSKPAIAKHRWYMPEEKAGGTIPVGYPRCAVCGAAASQAEGLPCEPNKVGEEDVTN